MALAIRVNSRYSGKYKTAASVFVVCCLCALGVSVVNSANQAITTETQRAQRMHREFLLLVAPQGPDLDYSNFKHSSDRHKSLACTSCHERRDNSATPIFPGHKACTSCHLAQFVTPNVPMCAICHSDVSNSNPPLKSFPTSFRESFNVKFDHAQHMNGAARPASGCAACHARAGGRAAALGIPAGLAAHNQCYTCHTPNSKSPAGREIASCGICHDQRSVSRTSTNAPSFRYAFSHAKHSPAQRLACADCHQLTPGAAQSRQVSSPAPLEHFAIARGKTCLSCHNGQRSFGGDLAFKECRRCHTGSSFKMPM
ncbi:MAG TPA: cytochrome c3 family protein [Pyrinomonadaceae bacterium]|nr:cytochrome c3 family protein [Pyrinomonadaceae bacterium]